MKIFLHFSIVFIILCIVSSCKTVTKIEKEIIEVRDTITNTLTSYDSIYIKDSTTIREKGESVFVDRWHTVYKEKKKEKDSVKIKIEYRDKTVEKEKIVEKKIDLKWYQNPWFYVTFLIIALIIKNKWKS